MNANMICSMMHENNRSLQFDNSQAKPSIYLIKDNALINVSKISLKTFIILAIVADNFVNFNQEPWKSTCKVVIESFRNKSYQFLIGQQERIYEPRMSMICSWRII
jgi:hypothetical protein